MPPASRALATAARTVVRAASRRRPLATGGRLVLRHDAAAPRPAHARAAAPRHVAAASVASRAAAAAAAVAAPTAPAFIPRHIIEFGRRVSLGLAGCLSLSLYTAAAEPAAPVLTRAEACAPLPQVADKVRIAHVADVAQQLAGELRQLRSANANAVAQLEELRSRDEQRKQLAEEVTALRAEVAELRGERRRADRLHRELGDAQRKHAEARVLLERARGENLPHLPTDRLDGLLEDAQHAQARIIEEKVRRRTAEQQRRADEIAEQLECVVCHEQTVNQRLPCGHLCLCSGCVETMVADAGPIRKLECPLCRKPAAPSEVERVYAKWTT